MIEPMTGGNTANLSGLWCLGHRSRKRRRSDSDVVQLEISELLSCAGRRGRLLCHAENRVMMDEAEMRVHTSARDVDSCCAVCLNVSADTAVHL